MIHWSIDSERGTEWQRHWDSLFSKPALGYLQLPSRTDNWDVSEKAAAAMAAEVQCLVVVGMGGSSLAGKFLVESLGKAKKSVLFLMNSDPFHLESCLRKIRTYTPKDVGFLVISKSGGTIEVAALVSSLVSQASEYFPAKGRVWVITEEKPSALSKWAAEKDFPVIAHPLDVGGRFSALSTVGLIPSAFSGVPLADLRSGAESVLEDKENLLGFANWAYETFLDGQRMTVFWSYSERLNLFLPWLQQLWAESLGKKENLLASTPVLSYGATDQHSVLQQYLESENDKSYVFYRDRSLTEAGPKLSQASGLGEAAIDNVGLGQLITAQSQATEQALKNEGYKTTSVEIDRHDAFHIGGLIMAFEVIIGLLGEKLEIDAFNQPSVEKGKKLTLEILGARRNV